MDRKGKVFECRPSEALESACSRDSPFLAVYGGGDQIRIASQIATFRIEDPVLDESFVDEILSHSQEAFQKWRNLETVQSVIGYPSEFPGREEFEVSGSIGVFQPAEVGSPHTLFFQGWMFHGEIEPGRLGITRYPLIGLYDSEGFLPPGAEDPNELSSFCPLNMVSPADQHAHLVQETLDLDGFMMELKEWHFGGPMAKIIPDPSSFCGEKEKRGGSGIAVCVDVFRKRIHICGLFLVCEGRPPSVEVNRDFLVERSAGRLKELIASLEDF